MAFYSCKKSSPQPDQTSCPPMAIYPISGFYKQFKFKAPSYWVFKNTTTNHKDSMLLTAAPSSYYPTQGISTACPSTKQYEVFQWYIANHLFQGCDIEYGISSQFSSMSINQHASSLFMQALYDKNAGDSVINNDGTWSKLEIKFQQITINNKSYTDVYQMMYHPMLGQIRRIWWTPNIGFVKIEFLNQTTNQTETCELDTANVQLYN
jgi:hypothetical protein